MTMRRLYLQIYLTFVGILVLFSVLLSVAWLFTPHDEDELRTFEGIEAVVGELLPGPDRSNAELQAVLERLHEKLPVHLAVHGPDGRLLAAVGDRLPRPRRGRTHSGLMRSRRAGATVAVRLPGRRWLVARHGPHDGRFAGGGWAHSHCWHWRLRLGRTRSCGERPDVSSDCRTV